MSTLFHGTLNDYEQQHGANRMKTAEDWVSENDGMTLLRNDHASIFLVDQIQHDAYKAGQAATMKWVSEECKKMLASIPLESNPIPHITHHTE